MFLKKVGLINSSISSNHVRLVGEVIYNDDRIHSELYWFDIPKRYSKYVSETGNPWLVCLLPLAVTLGEPLQICKPVDSTLLKNARKLMLVWKSWYPKLMCIEIECDKYSLTSDNCISETASFFSGGIDSFFTVLRNRDSENDKSKINDLLIVGGFDIPLGNLEAFSRLKEKYEKIAFSLDCNLIDFFTNIRETRWKMANWGYLAHGSGLASVALSLENKYKKVLIPSSYTYSNLFPWGSHPVSDPLLSSSRTRFIHDGIDFNRFEKTEYIAKNEIALNNMRVCWKSASDYNCSYCSKCYRTMITLEILGQLEYCKAFLRNRIQLSEVERVYFRNEHDEHFFSEIKNYALEKKRFDIVNSIDKSFESSRRLNKKLRFVKMASNWLSDKRFVWRWAHVLEKALLRNSID